MNEETSLPIAGVIRISEAEFTVCTPFFVREKASLYIGERKNTTWVPGRLVPTDEAHEMCDSGTCDFVEGEDLLLGENTDLCVLSPEFLDHLLRLRLRLPEGKMDALGGGDLIIVVNKKTLATWRQDYAAYVCSHHENTLAKIVQGRPPSPLIRTIFHKDMWHLGHVSPPNSDAGRNSQVFIALSFTGLPPEIIETALQDGAVDCGTSLEDFKALVEQERARLLALPL